MRIAKKVNGVEYIFECGRNYEIGEQIKGTKDGYTLIHCHNGFSSAIYLKSCKFFDKEEKNIGTLLYDHDRDIVTYKKYGFNRNLHEFKTTESIGLNWEIVSNLKPKDRIQIEEKTDKEVIIYSISVSKLLKYQSFKYFKSEGYEKQVFVPIKEFKQVEIKRSKSAGKRSYRKRKRDL